MSKLGKKVLGIMLAASLAITSAFPMQGVAAEKNGSEYQGAEDEDSMPAEEGQTLEELVQPTGEAAEGQPEAEEGQQPTGKQQRAACRKQRKKASSQQGKAKPWKGQAKASSRKGLRTARPIRQNTRKGTNSPAEKIQLTAQGSRCLCFPKAIAAEKQILWMGMDLMILISL